MRVKDIMSSEVRTISPTQPATEAWSEMRLYRIHHLVVLEKGKVVGVVSARDLKALEAGERRAYSVRDLMASDVQTVTEDTTVREAANLMRGQSIGSMPVLAKTKLVGIVTVTDLLELIGRGIPQASLETRWKPIRRAARHPRVRGPLA